MLNWRESMVVDVEEKKRIMDFDSYGYDYC